MSDGPDTVHRMGELTDRERAVLDFAALSWRSAGAREEAIRARFDLSPTRFAQLLNGLLDRPAALAYAPVTVNRLRRLRDRRARARSLAAAR